MKNIILASLLFSALSMGSDLSVRYRHVQSEDGKILATIDTKEKKVDYKEDPKLVVDELIKIVDHTVAECQKELAAKEPKKSAKIKK